MKRYRKEISINQVLSDINRTANTNIQDTHIGIN